MGRELIPYYKQYKEQAEIYLNKEDKNIGRSIQVTIGMRRKGVAIAEDKNNLYLIDSNNMVLFECEREGSETYMEDYTYRIRRTITGYYIREQTGMSRTIWPGKDDSYKRKTVISGVFYENGQLCEEEWWKIKGRWNDFQIGKYPIEMGCGLVFYNNVFYEIESLKPKFIISNHFSIESIFKDGVCEFNFSSDNKRLFVKIQKDQVIDCINVDDEERLYELVREVDDLSLFSFASNDNEDDEDDVEREQKRLKKKYAQIGFIRDGYRERLKEYYKYYIEYPLNPDYKEDVCLINRVFTRKQFENNEISLNSEEIERINKLRDLILDDFKKHLNGCFVFRFACHSIYDESYGIDCVFYSDFLLLRSKGSIKNLYKLLDYSGNPISSSCYNYVGDSYRTNPFTKDRNGFINAYNRLFIFDDGYFEMENGKMIVTPIPSFLKELTNSNNNDNYIYHKGDYIVYVDESDKKKQVRHYYNLNGEEIPIHYIPTTVIEYVPNILFNIKPEFEFRRNRFGTYNIEPIKYGKVLGLPINDDFESCIEQIRNKRKVLQNYNIRTADKVKTYFKGTEKEFTLYFVEYYPLAYCDINGNITLNKNIPELSLLHVIGANDS